MICLAKSRLMAVASALRVTATPSTHRKQLSLFSSSVGRSAEVSLTV